LEQFRLASYVVAAFIAPVNGNVAAGLLLASILRFEAIPEEALMSRKSDLDNRSNQMNPNNDTYGSSRGEVEKPDSSSADLDNRSNQMNPNNDAYRSSRKG
jgi:hypothetical protein